uniref:EamA-like transporter family n=1 Tax=Mimiviridae sp. ChoanoV1 TaxID=2596887 RepID=A0A5B8IHX8_9VIRU|nr:EamA-like transporter family [Mimiviridae sp. ChoanoV1]
MEAWIIYALITCIITSFSIIVMKYITNSNTDIISCIMLSYVLVGILALIYLFLYKKTCFNDLKNNYYSILFLSILGLFTGIFLIKSINSCNNPGYSHLIVNMNVILTLILSYFIFDIRMNYKTFLGSVIAIIGILIVIKYSSH